MRDITAEASKTIQANPDDIWAALTDKAAFKQFFFGSDVESDWNVGSPIHMRGEYSGKTYDDKGEILAADRPKTLEFSHWSPLSGKPDAPENYHVVSFRLAPEGNGTKVVLSQSNLKGGIEPDDIKQRAEYEKNWQGVLDGLAEVVGDPKRTLASTRS